MRWHHPTATQSRTFHVCPRCWRVHSISNSLPTLMRTTCFHTVSRRTDGAIHQIVHPQDILWNYWCNRSPVSTRRNSYLWYCRSFLSADNIWLQWRHLAMDLFIYTGSDTWIVIAMWRGKWFVAFHRDLSSTLTVYMADIGSLIGSFGIQPLLISRWQSGLLIMPSWRVHGLKRQNPWLHQHYWQLDGRQSIDAHHDEVRVYVMRYTKTGTLDL